jgi:hypothetical protein
VVRRGNPSFAFLRRRGSHNVSLQRSSFPPVSILSQQAFPCNDPLLFVIPPAPACRGSEARNLQFAGPLLEMFSGAPKQKARYLPRRSIGDGSIGERLCRVCPPNRSRVSDGRRMGSGNGSNVRTMRTRFPPGGIFWVRRSLLPPLAVLVIGGGPSGVKGPRPGTHRKLAT